MTSHIIGQRVNTSESYIFYFGIFICCATLIFFDTNLGSYEVRRTLRVRSRDCSSGNQFVSVRATSLRIHE